MHSSTFKPKIAIIYDWIDTAYGGAEKVLVALHQAFPEAPVYTSLSSTQKIDWAETVDVRTSFLQKCASLHHKPRFLLPLLPLAFESFDLSQFDVVISITSAFAKGVITKPSQLHICYLLTPPRYLYSHQIEYLAPFSKIFGLRFIVRQVLKYLRWWDQVAAQRPDVIVPISKLVAERCQTFYHRQPAEVLYPPVEALKKNPSSLRVAKLPAQFAVIISRLVSYKKIEVAITACIECQLPLVIIGVGEDESRLKKVAQGSSLIYFMGAQPQVVVNQVLADSTVLLMPGIEDFGIAAAEAVASGKPVIVHRKSGVAELLSDGKTGILLEELSVKSLTLALKKVLRTTFNPQLLTQTMRKYATTSFVQRMQKIVTTTWLTTQSRKVK